MNKLEEYRNTSANKQLSPYCEEGNHSFDCGCPDKEEGFVNGFDAAIALDLPVKFAEWLDSSTAFIHSPMRRVLSSNFSVELQTDKEAYEYWINNVYKP